MARFGGILANTVGDLAEINVNIPIIMFASTALLSGGLSFLLPETAGKPLPNTVEDCIKYESKTRGITEEQIKDEKVTANEEEKPDLEA